MQKLHGKPTINALIILGKRATKIQKYKRVALRIAVAITMVLAIVDDRFLLLLPVIGAGMAL